MAELLAHPLVRAGLLFAVIAVLAGIGALIVSKFRGGEEEEQPQASELLTNFRELHEQGELSAQEFRKIKTLLAEKLQQELSDKGEPGSDDRNGASARRDRSTNAD
jgi:hypothetical protein